MFYGGVLLVWTGLYTNLQCVWHTRDTDESVLLGYKPHLSGLVSSRRAYRCARDPTLDGWRLSLLRSRMHGFYE